MGKRGQIAVEYIMIIAITLMIIIPGVFLFRNFAFESNDRLIDKRLSEVSSYLIGKARKMYYYGPPSRSVINIEMPPQVNKMYIVRYSAADPADDEYYLGFEVLDSGGRKEYIYSSEIPIAAGETVPCADLERDCTLPRICSCFPDKFYAKGLKYFDLAAEDDCGEGRSCIDIRMFSGD